ncbi:ribosome assembly RNA-binding protein YhbY [Listeria sp. PSOL-1]|uniref:ribosome assembly RNA-binding protein YhbY n=1 Tax=Listeria sp. PSOL-1 TaxID=1844999 RepID=UPI0013D3C129|nr:ribosome assembly RNA-binding protein YhbY [Listeria sp. PSOL-1]
MLTGKQIRYLRKQAHALTPIFQVGKGGVNPNMVQQITEALEARELIKISILQNAEEDRQKIAETLSARTRSELVQVIGRTIILYKESRSKKEIILP